MNEIAETLRVPLCAYPGRFCINAARAIEGRSWGVSAAAQSEQGRR